jgi:hypothetical protein
MEAQKQLGGLWYFSKNVSLSALFQSIKSLVEADSKYLSVFIRLGSTNEYAVEFSYDLEGIDDIETAQRVYVEHTNAELKNIFKNNLIGYNIAAPLYKVK